MINNNVTNNFYILYHLALYLKNKLNTLTFKDIFSQEKNKIVIDFGISALEFSTERNLPYLILKNNFDRANKNSITLFEFLIGESVKDITIYNDDRIILINLTNDFDLYFIFIPSKLNLLITKGNSILASFKKNNAKDINDFLKVKADKPEEFKNIKEYISAKYFKIDKEIRNEIIDKNYIIPEEEINDINIAKVNRIFSDVKEKLLSNSYRLYEDNNNIRYALRGAEFTKEFEDVNKMLEYYIRRRMNYYNSKQIKENLLAGIRKKIEVAERKIINFKKQAEELSSNEELLIKGNLILSNLHKIKNYSDKILLKDIASNTEYEIKIDSKKTLSDNAQNLFRKYKMGKEALPLIMSKIAYYEKLKEDSEDKLKQISLEEDYKSLKKMDKENIKKEYGTETDSLFRKFYINEQFEVWVGKDSRSNDLLTIKYSSPSDYWFHIRGFSGSHTVLKRNSKDAPVPKEYIRYAASIAAYYSKARNAGTVPVAYCERKFVKKQKGFKEGSVIMEREKMIYVKPEIPEYFQKFLSSS